jgi:phosphonate transport system ATP-binding protein
MLRFEHIGKTFATGTVALYDVSFAVPRGQFCVILGPSGSGKSTLLRLVSGMLTPSRGDIVFDGTPITRKTLPAVQRRVGMVHQQFNLVPRLSVLDNVLAGALPDLSTLRVLLKLWPWRSVRRACELLEQVGLGEEHLYRRAALLSGGQQQRVAIARAFINSPDVVLADEPVASLDPTTSRGVLSLLKQASRLSGATVLCSLHQIELAVEFADRIIAIRDGALAFEGAPAALSSEALGSIYDSAAGPDGLLAGRPERQE